MHRMQTRRIDLLQVCVIFPVQNNSKVTLPVLLAGLLRSQLYAGFTISSPPEGRRVHFCHRVVQLWHFPHGRNLHPVRVRSNCFEPSSGERLGPVQQISYFSWLCEVLAHWHSSFIRNGRRMQETWSQIANIWHAGIISFFSLKTHLIDSCSAAACYQINGSGNWNQNTTLTLNSHLLWERWDLATCCLVCTTWRRHSVSWRNCQGLGNLGFISILAPRPSSNRGSPWEEYLQYRDKMGLGSLFRRRCPHRCVSNPVVSYTGWILTTLFRSTTRDLWAHWWQHDGFRFQLDGTGPCSYRGSFKPFAG